MQDVFGSELVEAISTGLKSEDIIYEAGWKIYMDEDPDFQKGGGFSEQIFYFFRAF